MSWGKKSKHDDSASSVPEATYIDRGCEMSGELRFRDNVRIDGQVEGEIYCEKSVVVGDDAMVRANIHAANVVIHGTVEGDVVASGETTLHKSSSVTGELKTGGIVVERGAQLRGCILINGVDHDRETRVDEDLFAGDGESETKAAPAQGPGAKTA